ncbi:Transcription factor [Niveomyces insectorum RCEF 264]|uniref:Transcription factor n=1 Tax=Niveomyces insectorum RCEF 264 TaxID=1081102 RepID=A0A167VL79_9HYPO|nr:Transcription factor [Niveomyces insectorum RCEF 264]
MASADEGKHTQSDDSSGVVHQENVSGRGHTARHSKQQVRHRASVACASCRDRRIRCVVPKGEAECTQCKRAGTECVIKNDDERRRPISKAYMSSLSDRISLLESMLVDRGVVPPPAVHPPKTRQDGQSKQPQSGDETQPASMTRHCQHPQQQQQQQDQKQQPQQQQQQQQQLFEQEHERAQQLQAQQQPQPPQQDQLLGSSSDLLASTPQAQAQPYFAAATHLTNGGGGQPNLSSDYGSPSLDDTSPPESAPGPDDYHMHDRDPNLEGGFLLNPDIGMGTATTATISAAAAAAGSMPTNSVMLSHSHHSQHSLQGYPQQQQQQPTPHAATMLPAGMLKETSPFRNLDPKKEDIVQRLLSTKGNLSFDQLSGRLRFFGPTANSHVYAECGDATDSREPPEQVRRAERIIRSLTTATHDYLLHCFWAYYNDVIYVLDREAFETSRETQNAKFYSSFLHITVLAMGYRFADRSRDDIKKISLGNRESTLQREAKYMLDIELERPGGIPSVQALLLLGDLECGVGRDNTGWMYSGMANRLAFDIGLHLDYRSGDMTDQEVDIRHMVMKAAIVIDKYWALFLGRPTSIKSQDIGMDLLTKRFSLMASFSFADNNNNVDLEGNGSSSSSSRRVPAKMSCEEIYEYLFELMELAGKIVETRDLHKLGDNGTGRGGGGGHSGGGPGGALANFAAIMPFAGSGYGGGGGGGGHGGGLGGGGGGGDRSSIFAANDAEESAYLHVISLDRQLQNWYRRLPDHLTWKPANIKAAPLSFFLLHQQYHVSMILLHRPWAKYGSILTSSDGGSSTHSHPSPSSPSAHRRDSFSSQTYTSGMAFPPPPPLPSQQQQHYMGGGSHNRQASGYTSSNNNHNNISSHTLGLGDPHSLVDDSRTTLSRSICMQQAIRVARIFWQHRQRFDGRRICITSIQHAGTAAIALIAALAYQQSSDADRRSYLGYLEILSYALVDMSHTYQPAQRMSDLLTAVLEQLRSDVYGPEYVAAGGGGGPMHPSMNNSSVSGRPGSVASSSYAGNNDMTPPGGAHSGWYGPGGNGVHHAGGAGAGTGGGTSGAGGSGNSNNGIDVYSVLPARRENADAGEPVQAFKKRRPSSTSRRASDFARPPPPLFSQPTPPASLGALSTGSGPHILMNQHQHHHHHQRHPGLASMAGLAPSSAATAAHHHHQNHHPHDPMMATYFSSAAGDGGGVMDPTGSLSLDFLSGLAVDLDGPDDRADAAAVLRTGGLDDYVFVPSGSDDSWALNGAGGSGPGGPHHPHGHGAFDMPMTDWLVGPSSMAAAAAQGTAAAAVTATATATGTAATTTTTTAPTSSSLSATADATPQNNSVVEAAERKATKATKAGAAAAATGSATGSEQKNRIENSDNASMADDRSTAATAATGGSSGHGRAADNADVVDANGAAEPDPPSPVSLSGLVKTAEKTVGEASNHLLRVPEDEEEGRNHDLDFFRF